MNHCVLLFYRYVCDDDRGLSFLFNSQDENSILPSTNHQSNAYRFIQISIEIILAYHPKII